MTQVFAWKNDIPVRVECEDELANRGVGRLCNIDSVVFVTSKHDNRMYEGVIEECPENIFCLKLEKTAIRAVDIVPTIDKRLMYVSDEGRVFVVYPKYLDDKEEIVIEEDAKCCSHGHSTPRRRVKISSIAASEDGLLFLTQNGQLWAQGNYPQLNIKRSDGVKFVDYFKGKHVSAVACGLNFSLALVQKRATDVVNPDVNDIGSDDVEDVFIYDCPKCINESTLSPLSQQSLSDICPLGLQHRKSSLDQSTSSTSSKGNNPDKKSIDETTSPSTEDEVIHRTETVKTDIFETKSCSALDARINGEKESDIKSLDESEIDGGEKRNSIFINTEVARQFLTRQLSWVSSYGNAGEEFLAEYTEGTSRIVRQNVSNVANLVYEGVRTVGDKVATLSRHVSGGSDTCNGNEDSFEELSIENLNVADTSCTNNNYDDLLVSSSSGRSDHEEDVSKADKIEPSSGVFQGSSLLATELYSWGAVSHGQLGIGDCIKRDRPSLISKLSGTGIQRIGCGLVHSVALTLDGRMFAWGANMYGQVDGLGSSSLTSPCQVIVDKVGTGSNRAWDIASGLRHSVMLSHGGDIFYIGKHKDSTASNPTVLSVNEPDLIEEGVPARKQLVAHNAMTLCVVFHKAASPAVQDLALEQTFLEECLLVQSTLLRPFHKKLRCNSITDEHNVLDNLLDSYSHVVSFTALNAKTLWDYAESGGDPSSVAMVRYVDSHIEVYRKYLSAACNVLSLSAFAAIGEPSLRICELFADRLPPLPPIKKGTKRNISEATISCALLHPLSRLNIYKCIFQSLMRCNNSSVASETSKAAVAKVLGLALGKWECLCDESDRKRKDAELTRRFWECAGRLETMRSPTRRLIRESRSHPIQVTSSNRFSSHWLILFNDVLIHMAGSLQNVHPLSTLWVEPIQGNENEQHGLTLTMPEETLVLHTSTAQDKNEWLQAFKTAINSHLSKPLLTAMSVRHATYSFTKSGPFKDAKYTGRWQNGKMQGPGRMEWFGGRVYIGEFSNSQQHGYGRMTMTNGDEYEGQWRDGAQNGRGIWKYSNGDEYKGYFKDGLPHGHGKRQEGHFTSRMATVYIGEWSAGVKQGYGVMDYISTGERYLGMWSNNLKHGSGVIVTLDGIYYEGTFSQDVLTGHGLMVYEDGTYYEGEFRSAGYFNGKGTLTLNNGDRLEGVHVGLWNDDGIKFTGTFVKSQIHAVTENYPSTTNANPNLFGKLCVQPHQKWKSIYRQCLALLSVPTSLVDSISSGGRLSGNDLAMNGTVAPCIETQRLWENVAVSITTSLQEVAMAARVKNFERRKESIRGSEELDTIPQWGRNDLDIDSYKNIVQYLIKAFDSPHHPLGILLADLTSVFTATYGGVRVHPLLLSHAVDELHLIMTRLYEVVRLLFPALPPYGQKFVLLSPRHDKKDAMASGSEFSLDDNEDDDYGEEVSSSALLHPFVFPRVHSALFFLYALVNKKEDDAYRKRLLKWNKRSEKELLVFLAIDPKIQACFASEFPVTSSNDSTALLPSSPSHGQLFTEAIETLQQLKTTFTPFEKLFVIQKTFERLTQAVQSRIGSEYKWSMDTLFPVFYFVVLRSSILQLGSEIQLIEDFMEPRLKIGEKGIMFTTLKACYYHILQEKCSTDI